MHDARPLARERDDVTDTRGRGVLDVGEESTFAERLSREYRSRPLSRSSRARASQRLERFTPFVSGSNPHHPDRAKKKKKNSRGAPPTRPATAPNVFRISSSNAASFARRIELPALFIFFPPPSLCTCRPPALARTTYRLAVECRVTAVSGASQRAPSITRASNALTAKCPPRANTTTQGLRFSRTSARNASCASSCPSSVTIPRRRDARATRLWGHRPRRRRRTVSHPRRRRRRRDSPRARPRPRPPPPPPPPRRPRRLRPRTRRLTRPGITRCSRARVRDDARGHDAGRRRASRARFGRVEDAHDGARARTRRDRRRMDHSSGGRGPVSKLLT